MQAVTETFTLKSAQFRRERTDSWRQLEGLLDRIEKKGISSLRAEELNRLPILYRSAASSLSVARAISLDRNLQEYLEGLVGRAYICVYTTRRPLWQVLSDFFLRRFPGGVFACRHFLLVAGGLVLLGFLCGFVLTLEDPGRFLSFVPEEMAQGRTPDASDEELRDVLFDRPEGASGLTFFASFLFTHNAKIGLLCFSLGFAAGLPVVLLLFYNGLMLGAMAALYHSRAMGGDFLAWVMGHGVTEIGALIICGAAGLVLGQSLLFPGRFARSVNLATRGRMLAPVAIGSVLMFLIAALLEGYFRQLVASTSLRFCLAAATLVFWVWYFGWVGRRSATRPITEVGPDPSMLEGEPAQ